MKIGQAVKIVIPPIDNMSKKGSVKKGALAIVVDGYEEFPYLYKKLSELVKNHIDEFIWIKWTKDDPRWCGRIDGAYLSCRFAPARIINCKNVLN